MSTAKARLIRRIRRYLSIWKENIGLDNELGLTDINSDAEDFCCGLLNIVLEADLRNLNLLRMNFPAIDLADQANRLCVQVTSTAGAEKITHTLDRFFAHGLDTDYDRLIVMVLGKKKNYRTQFPEKEGFSFDPSRDVWDIQKLLTQIAGVSMQTLGRIDAYLREQFDDLEELAPPMDLPVRSALDDATFLGRQRELEEITRRFDQNEKVVFLSGLGGMGKSELAIRFAQTRWGSESYFVHFTKNWRKTVLENIAPRIRGLNREGADLDRIYRDAMAELKNRGSDELLILDNVDQEEASLPQLKRELSELSLRVLVTTRTEAAHAIAVDALHRAELLRFFELHESTATLEERIALIRAVDGHTLTVDLIARALRPGRRAATAEKLLRNLSDTTIRKVDTAYPGAPAQARIIEHLKVVFRVSELEEDEKRLLRYATLLPEGGMLEELFLSPIDDDVEDALDSLLQNGWLQWKDDALLIHPVIRKVCFETLAPNDDNCGGYLNTLIDGYDEKDFQKDRCRQIAEMLEKASRHLEDTRGRWALESAERWRDVGEYAQAHAYSLRAMERMEKNLPPDDPALAQAYNRVGISYDSLGNHRKALEYFLSALEIRKRVLSADHPDLAISYSNMGSAYYALGDYRKSLEFLRIAMNTLEKTLPHGHIGFAQLYYNMGNTYGALGDYWKALEYGQKALNIFEKDFPADHPYLARSYYNMGNIYDSLGNRGKALEFLRKALTIQEKVLPHNHPELAHSYYMVSYTLCALGNPEKAIEFQQKALEVLQTALPHDHPALADSYKHMGSIYRDLGDYKKALEYTLKALAIQETALTVDHPGLASTYSDVGLTYFYLGDTKKALDYLQKALETQEKMLPHDHPHLATSYNNVGNTYCALGDHRKALDYHQKALGIRETALPSDHPDLAQSYNNMGSIYLDIGDHRMSLEYQLKALEIRGKTLSHDHPDLATSYNDMGITYSNLGDHKKALEFHQKALTIWEHTLPSNHPHLATSCTNIAGTYHALGQYQEATRYMRRAADIISRSSLPEDHPDRVNYPNWADQFEQDARMQQAMMAVMQKSVLPPFGLPGK